MTYNFSRRMLAMRMRHSLIDPNQAPPQDTLDRALWRVQTVLDGFYDDEEPEPRDQGPVDLLTDLMHLCDERGLSIHEVFTKAQWMFDEEQQEWTTDADPWRPRESPNTDSRSESGEF